MELHETQQSPQQRESSQLRRIEPQDVHSLEIVRKILPWREQLASGFGTHHGNANLQLIDVLIVLLAAFYNPMVRSQRLVEALSSQLWMRRQTGIERIARSTLSDAMKRFDPEQLKPLVKELTSRVASLGQRDPDLASLTRQVIAADGTYLNLAGEVLWALQCRRGGLKDSVQARVRLDLQLDVGSFSLTDGVVSGKEASCEAASFIGQIKPGVIYLADRGFMHFGFLKAVLAKGSNFVVRLKKDVRFAADASHELIGKDKEFSVIADETGHLPGPTAARDKRHKAKRGQNGTKRGGHPPTERLRRVTIYDSKNNCQVTLLTDLLDVPAWMIAVLYRKRWLIELFLRFLKCTAAFDHMISMSQKGMTLQLYVAMIATLLLHLATGQRVSKYSLFWLGSIASGHATWEEMQAGLARIQREKMLEKARLLRKKLMAQGLEKSASE